ncbi:hypothetical protein TeGR_g2497 [Tetraparma gracilis]|uniref:Uncharacterized protein n=1 Tax=Tetraparma gracilis TaxID=2962635 RepID=A0ABQ6N2G0_9STRA|nr:hypothetical protein TeGR_g2497 [Tetraparma gracilis]
MLAGELMHSTKPASAASRAWVRLAPCKARDPCKAYSSSDGSATGWHAAVFVAKGADEARVRARFRDCEGSRNVGAEAWGFQLGVESVSEVPGGAGDVVFLADFLNALAWDVGAAKYNHPAMKAAYDGKGGVKEMKRSLKAKGDRWDHVHHPGHKTDDSWFTLLNQVADNLASCQVEIDATVTLEELKELVVQGKGGVERKAAKAATQLALSAVTMRQAASSSMTCSSAGTTEKYQRTMAKLTPSASRTLAVQYAPPSSKLWRKCTTPV